MPLTLALPFFVVRSHRMQKISAVFGLFCGLGIPELSDAFRMGERLNELRSDECQIWLRHF